MAGLYLHIPFCKSRCIYCAFYSSTLSKLQDSYTEAMCSEMLMRPSAEPIRSIYLGGGTPSVLSADNLNRLFIYINKVYFPGTSTANDPWAGMRDCEITMECNPDDISDEFCLMLRQLPVNRISMGIQTFDNDDRLRFLRRRHTAEGAVASMKRLRKAGIPNISIDLMFGFPGQTLSQWDDDIGKALAMEPEHISAYSLTYEEDTPLYDLVYNRRSSAMCAGKRPTNRNTTADGAAVLQPISDELSLSMYELLIDRLTAAGYEHYEISCEGSTQTPLAPQQQLLASYTIHWYWCGCSQLRRKHSQLECSRPSTLYRQNQVFRVAFRERSHIADNGLQRHDYYCPQNLRRNKDKQHHTKSSRLFHRNICYFGRSGLGRGGRRPCKAHPEGTFPER